VNRTLGATQTRLRDLAQDKLRETSQRVEGLAGGRQAGAAVPVEPQTLRSLDMAVLLHDLDSLFSMYSGMSDRILHNKIPIYGAAGPVSREKKEIGSALTPWRQPISPLVHLLRLSCELSGYILPQTEKDVVDVLRDFTVDQRSRKNIEAEWREQEEKKRAQAKTTIQVGVVDKKKKEMKMPRRGSNSVLRMAARKEERRSAFQLKEFQTRSGEKHFLVVKSKMAAAAPAAAHNRDVEDIFADWRVNLQRRRAQRRPRHRKLSHRAERRQIINAAKSASGHQQLTYAEIARRNLKRVEQPSVEEIFSAWTANLQELNALLVEQSADNNKNSVEAAAKNSKEKLNSEDMADIFFPFRHNFHVPRAQPEDVDILATAGCLPFAPAAAAAPPFHCGQPTVLTALKGRDKPLKSPPASAVVRIEAGKTTAATPSKIIPAAKSHMKQKRLQPAGKYEPAGKAVSVKAPHRQPQEGQKLPVLMKAPEVRKVLPPVAAAAEVKATGWNARLAARVSDPPVEGNSYAAELIFADWIGNLKEVTPARIHLPLEAADVHNHTGYEVFFLDWCHNLREPEKRPASGSVSPKGEIRGQKRRLREVCKVGFKKAYFDGGKIKNNNKICKKKSFSDNNYIDGLATKRSELCFFRFLR
jgi:hypothetical protein